MPSTPTSTRISTARFRFPAAFTIPFALIILVAALTWIIPAGLYDRVRSEALGKHVPIAGSYKPTGGDPQGVFDVILAPVAGFYDPGSYAANAIDVSLFVLIIGGFIGVVTYTGAIDAGIARAMVRLRGRENWMIPFLMALFALGVASQDWWMAQMSGLFLIAAIIIGLFARLGEARLVEAFLTGTRDLLGVALIIGLVRGIVVVTDAGHITDTILHWAETTVTGLPGVAFINVNYWIEDGMSFLVPSTSGLAVLSMPILAPVADFAGVKRELVVTAFATGSGVVNLITPTSAVVMGGLAIGRVPYER